MTIQETIDKAHDLPNLLESMRDNGGIDIITAGVDDYSGKRPPLSVHLYSGIEAAAETLEQASAVVSTGINFQGWQKWQGDRVDSET